MNRALVCGITAAICMATAAYGTTIYVNGTTGDDAWSGLCAEWDGGTCGPKVTIQAGIQAAIDGDVVEIADGTYTGEGNKDLDFHGKAIIVRSENGPNNCDIDCEGDGRGFYFYSGETAESVVDGFTITNGYVGNGAGIYCTNNSSPTISNCMITGNTAETFGGGIACHDGSPIISNCTISENLSLNDGGGIHCHGVVRGMSITNCTISNNVALSDGGGLRCNQTGYHPINNPQVTNCRITDNSASIGAGITCVYSALKLTNCTIANNTASSLGGGIWCYFYSNPRIANCILWGNTPDQVHPHGDGDNPRLRFCDIEGGWEGEGNIDDDPLFVDPGNDDYHLSADSPCIDAADSTAVPRDEPDLDEDGCTSDRVPLDLDSNYRFHDDPATDDTGIATFWHPAVDMGAYEFGSGPDVPPGPCFGDLNCDGEAEFFDIDGFILAVIDPEEYEASFPDCDPLNADVNEDGLVDFFDIDAFVALVVGG